jgi:hypothetical protein
MSAENIRKCEDKKKEAADNKRYSGGDASGERRGTSFHGEYVKGLK